MKTKQLLCALILLSCNQPKQENVPEEEFKEKEYSFLPSYPDSVVYYSRTISADYNADSLKKESSILDRDKLLSKIVRQNFFEPSSISHFHKYFNKKRTIIREDIILELNSFFVVKRPRAISVSEFNYEHKGSENYRDIFIYYQNKRAVACAKFCFDFRYVYLKNEKEEYPSNRFPNHWVNIYFDNCIECDTTIKPAYGMNNFLKFLKANDLK